MAMSIATTMSKALFPAFELPRIYAYSDSRYAGCLKVGYTTKTAAARVAEQYPVKLPNQSHTIVLDEIAMRGDGSLFTDRDVHAVLKRNKVKHRNGEWFECDLATVRAAIIEAQTGKRTDSARTERFAMRPEQAAAVSKTQAYFKSFSSELENAGKTPHFLWNAKMRFGKTFATYQLAKRMGWTKVLVLTFKPAVQDAWKEDLENHTDFADWQFVARDVPAFAIDGDKPLVFFASLQDILGKNSAGGIKARNEWVHATRWDCVVFDEYHYGAWNDHTKGAMGGDTDAEEEAKRSAKRDKTGVEEEERVEFLEANMPIKANAFLYLSGTPFRAIQSGEFIEEQIFNWTYSDEQRAKQDWALTHGEKPNPYAALPHLVLLTYQLPPAMRAVAAKGEFDEFDLNEFFKADGTGKQATFKYLEEVQKWLNLIRGGLVEATVDHLKLGASKSIRPFVAGERGLQERLLHTLWYLPNVAACHAMRNLLAQKQNTFYQDFSIVVAAGNEAGMGVDALVPVKAAMEKPLHSKSITLSCGKLTTGVSVAPWTGIFMLRNITSPETYFQAAFRVQTPWVIRGHDANDPNAIHIQKQACYVFDFAPDRALKQIAEYSCRLNVDESNPETKVAEFIKFLPVLACDDSSMLAIDAAGILQMAMSGTTATLLARRWESALLVNVDNATLNKLMNSPEAMQALMNIEGFRSLNKDIETIINKSDSVKKAKATANERDLTPKEKKQLTEEEKEFKSKRKEIQEKLIKFATRVPVFMYLSDFREFSLKDVITQLEPDLFKKVTGLTQKDFEVLVRLGVFNDSLMNDAVYKFKRYEDSSLEYTGLTRKRDGMGLWNTVLSEPDLKAVESGR
jgi:hypothetical protein